MTNYLLILLLIAHFLGDFYFQTDNLAKGKKKEPKKLLLHSCIYGLTTLIVLLFTFEWILLLYLLGIAVSHLIIDFLKLCIKDHERKRYVFVLDQLIHVIIIVVASILYTENFGQLVVYGFLDNIADVINLQMITVLKAVLILIIILKPTNISFVSLYPKIIEDEDDKEEKEVKINHGKSIGNLERIIVVVLLFLHQYEALGFVIAGKSVARFKSDVSADYFIVGTFYSILVAIVTFILVM